MKKFVNEFRTFAKRGNIFDLAVGIIIGGAFGKIVSSFVNDLFTPIISLILGRINVAELKIVLNAAQEGKPELALRYGMFIQSFIDFLLIAIAVFFMMKLINRMKRKEEQKSSSPAPPSNQEKLLSEIRDILKERNKKI